MEYPPGQSKVDQSPPHPAPGWQDAQVIYKKGSGLFVGAVAHSHQCGTPEHGGLSCHYSGHDVCLTLLHV